VKTSVFQIHKLYYEFKRGRSVGQESGVKVKARVTNVLQNPLRADILTVNEEPAYEKFLNESKFGSIQWSIDWRNTLCSLGHDRPYFIVAKKNDKIVGALPLYFYKNEFGSLLTTIAWHTTSGIVCSRNSNRGGIYKTLLECSVSLAEELDCTVMSVSTNALWDDREYYLQNFGYDYAMENFIQYICLNEIFDDKGNIVHPNYTKRSNLSRNLKKAKMQPITISDEQSRANVDEYFEIYKKRMKELDATLLPKEFFLSALENLTLKGKGKFLFAYYKGKMVAGCLFLSDKRIMDVYTISMDSEYNKLRANFLLTYYMLKWAHKNGVSILNWMSSPRKGDGVYNWKEQWGSHERTFLYLTKVLHDISEWKKMDCRKLAQAYNLHYLLPFNLLKSGKSSFTSKNALASFMQSLAMN